MDKLFSLYLYNNSWGHKDGTNLGSGFNLHENNLSEDKKRLIFETAN